MNLLIYILILFLIFGGIFYVIRMMPIEQPFKNIALGIVGVIFIIMLLSLLFGGFPVGHWRLP